MSSAPTHQSTRTHVSPKWESSHIYR